MIPKPSYLGPEHASRFQDRSVVDAYHHRPPYPAELFEILAALITDEPRAVLDVGSGSGDIARRLVPLVERVDAVDFSKPMLEKGQQLPGGEHPHLRWLYGRAEEASLFPPYALITAGQSLHWMDWDKALPRFHDVLTPNGYLAIVNADTVPLPWNDDLLKIIKQYSTNRDYKPVNLIRELELRGLFQRRGEKRTVPTPFVQSLEHYLEAFHSMSSFSREYMTTDAVRSFDYEVRELVSRFAPEGTVTLQVVATVVWGRPQHTRKE